jgi:hypothetical protein
MWSLVTFSQLDVSIKMVAHLAAENFSLKWKEFSSAMTGHIFLQDQFTVVGLTI